jgi:hypothetical protein
LPIHKKTPAEPGFDKGLPSTTSETNKSGGLSDFGAIVFTGGVLGCDSAHMAVAQG